MLLFLSCLKAFRLFSVSIISPVDPSTASDGNIVCVNLPVLAETHPPSSARSEDSVRSERKVFRAVGGPKRQAYWQVLPASGKDGQHLSGSPSVRNLVETLTCVNQCHEHTPCDFVHNAVGASNKIHSSEYSSIYSSVIHYQAALSLPSVFRKVFRGKRRARPFAVSSNELTTYDILLELFIHPLRFLALETVRGSPAGWPCGNGIVNKISEGGPWLAINPKDCGLASQDLPDCSHIMFRQPRPCLTFLESQSFDNFVSIGFRTPGIRFDFLTTIPVD